MPIIKDAFDSLAAENDIIVIEGAGSPAAVSYTHLKIAVIEAALALHKPDSNDSIDVLHKVGGLDIAGLCGLYLGAAAQRIPVVLDGVISCAAALLAVRLCPQSVHFMVAAHRLSLIHIFCRLCRCSPPRPTVDRCSPWTPAVSYTHLDVYKRQILHPFNV